MLAFQNISGYVLIFVVLISACASQDCSGACTLQYRCNPYYKQPVWSIVEGPKCVIFQNSCLFNSANCQRKNNCLAPMIATTKKVCKQFCPTCTGVANAPVCGVFSFVALDGTNTDEFLNFENKCELEKYACNNAKAYYYYNDWIC